MVRAQDRAPSRGLRTRLQASQEALYWFTRGRDAAAALPAFCGEFSPGEAAFAVMEALETAGVIRANGQLTARWEAVRNLLNVCACVYMSPGVRVGGCVCVCVVCGLTVCSRDF
jgi:hypothetical protein